MRKWYVAGAVLLLLGAAVVVALLNLNTLIKRNRDFLLSQAEQALGRKITAGDVELSIMHGIGLRVKNFAISDDPSFSTGEFVRARDLQINVRLWPLLQKQFEIKNVTLRQPVVTISRNAAGDFNFSSIGNKNKERREAKTNEARARREKTGTPSVAVYLANIVNGEVIYRDQKEDAHLDLKRVDLTVKQASGSKPISAELQAALFSDKPNLNLEVSVAPILPDTDISRLRLSGTIDVDPLDVTALQAAVPTLKSLLPKELRWSGTFGISKGKFNGTLENLALKGVVEGTRAAIRFGKNFSKASGVPLELAADAQYTNETIYLRNADLKLHTLALNSKGEIHLGDEPTVNISVDAKPTALNGWEKVIPAVEPYRLSGTMEVHALLRGRIGKKAFPDVHGTATLTSVAVQPPKLTMPVKDLNARINFNGQGAETKGSSLGLGSSKLRFAANVEKFAPLTLAYSVSTSEIRPAEFQTAVAEEHKDDVLRNVSTAGRLTVAGGQVTFEGKLESSQGMLRKIAFQRLDTTLAVADKVVRLNDLRVNALGGDLTGKGEYAFGEAVPRFSADAKIRGMDINEFYRSLKAKTQRDLHGRLNASATLAGSGRNWSEVKPNLRGQGEAEIVQGALLNFNLANAALSATGIPGLGNLISPQVRKKYPETFEAKDTKFKQMKAHFDVADGRVNVKDLLIAAADYSVQGDGWVNFERKINFRAALNLSPALSADLAQSMSEVRFLFNNDNEFTMPMTVTGTLPRVKARPDSRYVARMFQRGAERQGLEELQRRFFGNKESSAPKEGDASEQQPAQKRKKKQSTEELIRKGLEGLFRR
jgi:uncharacterized protein involved in outer membrane biogenesis